MPRPGPRWLRPARSRHSESSSIPYGGSVTNNLGLRSASNRETSSALVASPHSRRCSPKKHRFPGRGTATSGRGGASSAFSSSIGSRRSESSSCVEPGEPEIKIKIVQLGRLHCKQILVQSRRGGRFRESVGSEDSLQDYENGKFKRGGQGRNRTADASLFRAALYQLSYLAATSRLENPPILALRIERPCGARPRSARSR